MKPEHKQPPTEFNLNLCITSQCNRRCPECCIGVGLPVDGVPYQGHDMSFEEIQRVGELMGQLNEIHVTGGEPSFHRDWVHLAPRLRSVLRCRKLVLFCNGWGFRRFPESFLNFDRIIVTIYNGAVFPGCPSNEEDVEFMRQFMAGHGRRMEYVAGNVVHYPRKLNPESKGCVRASTGMLSYWEGKLYGCCVAPGIDGRVGIELTADWHQQIMQTELPCARCMFG